MSGAIHSAPDTDGDGYQLALADEDEDLSDVDLLAGGDASVFGEPDQWKQKKPHKRSVGKAGNIALFDHFVVTDEICNGYKKCYCKCCDLATLARKDEIHSRRSYCTENEYNYELDKLPKRKYIVRRKRDCARHLKKCRHYQKQYPDHMAFLGPILDSFSVPSSVQVSREENAQSPSRQSLVTTNSFLTEEGDDGGKQRHALFASAPATSRNKKRKTLQSDIRSHLHSALPEQQAAVSKKLLLELVIDSGLPFSFVDRPSFIRFVNSIRAGTSGKWLVFKNIFILLCSNLSFSQSNISR